MLGFHWFRILLCYLSNAKFQRYGTVFVNLAPHEVGVNFVSNSFWWELSFQPAYWGCFRLYLKRGGRNRGVNLPSPYFLSQFSLLPTHPGPSSSILPTPNFCFSPSSLLFPPISPTSQLFLGHFSLLPILFLPTQSSTRWCKSPCSFSLVFPALLPTSWYLQKNQFFDCHARSFDLFSLQRYWIFIKN